MNTKTKCLFYEDLYLSKFSAKVLDSKQLDDNFEIILDQTAFYPEGGGQPGDQGYLNNIKVIDTYYKDDYIVHLCDNDIAINTYADGLIDWDLRYRRMQSHSGEHIISGIINKLYGYNNIGFHMNDDLVTIDYDGKITTDELDKIETLCNKVIYNNLPINLNTYLSQDAANLSYRSKKELDGEIRIVKIDDVDSCACCGTHVKTTGEIGLIHFISLKNYKKGVRIEVILGETALDDYRKKEKLIQNLNSLFSSTTDKLLENILLLKEKYDNLNQKLIEKNKEIFNMLIENLQPVQTKNLTYCYINYPNITPKEIDYLAKLIFEKYKLSALITSTTDDTTYFSYISDTELGNKTNLLRKEQIIRGGGNNTQIQGELLSSIDKFFDVLSQL